MIAVVKIGGHQALIEEVGEQLEVDKLNGEPGDKVKFETLVLSSPDGKDCQIGAPSLGEKVEAKIVEHGRGDKIRVYKMNPRKRYRRERGHRQEFSVIEITSIGGSTVKAPAKKKEEKAAEPKEEKKAVAPKKAAPKKTAAKKETEK